MRNITTRRKGVTTIGSRHEEVALHFRTSFTLIRNVFMYIHGDYNISKL